MTASEAINHARVIKSLDPETLIEPRYMRSVLEGLLDAYDSLLEEDILDDEPVRGNPAID